MGPLKLGTPVVAISGFGNLWLQMSLIWRWCWIF